MRRGPRRASATPGSGRRPAAPPVSRQKQVQAEFGRQAAAMAEAPAFRAADVLRRIRRALGPAPLGRVLDVACGPGLVLEALAGEAEALAGVDATPRMLALARTRLATRLAEAGAPRLRLQAGQAEALPFPAACFDAVVTRLGLHHLEDPAAALREMRRVLRPGGRLVVADLATSSHPEEAALHEAIERLRDPTHVRLLSRDALVGAVEEAGFAVARVEAFAQARRFAEWAAVVAAPERTDPLRTLLLALARRGERAGIDLREEDGEPVFTHTWTLVEGRAAGPAAGSPPGGPGSRDPMP